MAENWQTIEQAAVSLRLSVRTVNRHIAAGKLESRLNEGRREVLVHSPDARTAQDSGAAAPQASDPADESASTMSVDPEAVLALADNAAQKAEMAVTAYQTLARMADAQMKQVRRSARFAWTCVAVMVIGTTVMLSWTTHRWTRVSTEADAQLTAANMEKSHLLQQLSAGDQREQELSDKLDRARNEQASVEKLLRGEITAAQGEIAAARQQAARAEGQVAAYQEQEQARQTQAILAAARATEPLVSALPTVEIDHSFESQGSAVHANLASTRPTALRRKARAPATRPTLQSDTSSASTADEP